MLDRLQVQTHDCELLAEIETLVSLMLACSTTSARLSDDAIDAALGLSRDAARQRSAETLGSRPG